MLDSAAVRILWRYVLGRFLSTLAATLASFVLLIVVIELMLDLDRIVESREGLSTVFLNIISSYLLQYLIPAAALVAAFFSIGTAARSREITALKAGGVSPLVASIPILAVGALLAGAAVPLSDTISVTASQALRRRVDDSGDLRLRKGTFWYHSGRFIYNFAEGDGRNLHEVVVFELDGHNRLLRRLAADEASVAEGSRWLLHEATVHHFDPDRPGEPPRVERSVEISLDLAREPSPALLRKEVATLSMADLRRLVQERGQHGRDTTRARALLHTRLSEPLSVLLFSLLAVPLGLRVEQTRSLSRGALQGVALLFFYYLARDTAANLALEGVLPAVAPWGVLALFGAGGAASFARSPR
jgi:lipopolysaccharide export LptBFGC system permease protein LptF